MAEKTAVADKRKSAAGTVSKNSKNTAQKKKTTKKQKSKTVPFALVIILTLAAYFGYSYIVGQVTKINTETAQLVMISDTVSTVGVAIRDETVITSGSTGVVVSVAENGGKVYKGETIVNVFSSDASAQAYLRINEINDALDEFESMSTAGEENAAEISTLEKQIDNKLYAFTGSLYSGDIEDALERSEDILYLLNKSQIATKQVDNFAEKVNELKAERDRLTSAYPDAPVSQKSPMSGYFISEVDGYEEILRTDILDGLTPEQFDNIMEMPVKTYDSSVIGKIADDYIWYIVCNVTAEDADGLTVGKFYNIRLPYSEAESVEAKVESITPDAAGENMLLVFKCTYMVPDIASFRSQPIIIVKKSFKGLGVSLSALASVEESQQVSTSDGLRVTESVQIPGVYILWGNEVKFKKIKELYRDGDTVVCSIESGSSWLKMYDEVIVNNDNMYDGKIVNAS